MTDTTSSAEALSQASSSSFYSGMRILPRRERHAMYAIYAFCRAVDDIADDQQGSIADRRAELNAWRADFEALYGGGEPGRAAIVAEAVSRFRLAKADFLAVIDGMEMDVDEDIRAPDLATFSVYCDRVACAVGRLAVRVFGMDQAPGLELAHHLGLALQITNILRDIDEDAAIGRLYVPGDYLTANGITSTEPANVINDPRFDGACRMLAARAADHYARANAILSRHPKGLLVAPKLMEAVYSRLLGKMEAAGWTAPRQRVRVSKRGLIWTVIKFVLTR